MSIFETTWHTQKRKIDVRLNFEIQNDDFRFVQNRNIDQTS